METLAAAGGSGHRRPRRAPPFAVAPLLWLLPHVDELLLWRGRLRLRSLLSFDLITDHYLGFPLWLAMI
jgi:hypothetical protein